jgi:hypothetical protein
MTHGKWITCWTIATLATAFDEIAIRAFMALVSALLLVWWLRFGASGRQPKVR